jgi:hypothetical protein
MIRTTTCFLHPVFYVRVELLGIGDVGPGSEHDLGRLCRKLATGVRGSGLDDDGPALDRTSD